MATQYDPIAKDGSLNTTETTPRNIADVLAEGLKGIEDALPPSYTEGDGINISNDEISVDTTFTEASTRANIASGDSFSTILGKIKKFFTDLKTVAFTGAYSDLSGTPDLTNVAYKNVNNQFSTSQNIDAKDGTTTAVGTTYVRIGNNIAEGTAGNSKGFIQLYGKNSFSIHLQAADLTNSREIKLPDANGTLALTSDLPVITAIGCTANSNIISSSFVSAKQYGKIVLVTGYYTVSGAVSANMTQFTLSGVTAYGGGYGVATKVNGAKSYVVRIDGNSNIIKVDTTPSTATANAETFTISMVFMVN